MVFPSANAAEHIYKVKNNKRAIMSETGDSRFVADSNQGGVSSDHIDAEDLDGPLVGTVDGATQPSRELQRLTSTVRTARHDESVRFELGTEAVQVSREGEVVGKKGERSNRVPHLDVEFALEVAVTLPETPPRLYRICMGDDRYGDWFVFSYHYHEELGMIDVDSEIAHGWAIAMDRLG